MSKIVTDSTCDLRARVSTECENSAVPIHIQYDTETPFENTPIDC
jgi:fatty acid-binding protein DegV